MANEAELAATAQAIVADGKGVLAADESNPTIKKRFDTIGVESTEENRRAYRELLFTTVAAADHIGGVILYDETLRQSTAKGERFADLLARLGSIPGIKVDRGAKPLAGAPGEKVTEGLDGLRERLSEYHALGARFTKWRAVIDVSDSLPSAYGMHANAHALARYAALSQEVGLVPIVEPEIMVMVGDHSIERSAQVTEATLEAVFHQLALQRVSLEGMLLKPNMVLPGDDCSQRAVVAEVAERTVTALKRTVPGAVPGVVFLSGGQTETQATEHLNAMNAAGDLPWRLSFSYGRALQASALAAWSGQSKNVELAQRTYAHRAKMNSLAATGKYSDETEAELRTA